MTIQGIMIPWRRKRAKELSDLEASEKQSQIKKIEAEVQEINTRTAQAEVDPELAQIAKDRARAEVRQIQLVNAEKQIEIERSQLALQREKIELAMSIINQFAPGLPEAERILQINRLVEPLNVLINSRIEIKNDDE